MNNWIHRIITRLRNTAAGGIAVSRTPQPIHESMQLIAHRQQYLLHEMSELRSQMRFLLAQSDYYAQEAGQTRASFDYQWKHLPSGKMLLSDLEFKNESIDLVCQYTELPRQWFSGKRVLDAGCGNGRWSYALCSLGAVVHSVDVSENGVRSVKEACSSFPTFSAEQHNLLESLGKDQQFDLVWCFGVIHHTGNTYRALQNVAACVRAGGHIFLHVYGEPREDHMEDYIEVNMYMNLRRELRNLDFDQRVEFLRDKLGDEYLHTWFDAASPQINDLHRFDEIVGWLVRFGFSNIRRTVDGRNHIMMAYRP